MVCDHVRFVECSFMENLTKLGSLSNLQQFRVEAETYEFSFDKGRKKYFF